MSYLADLGFHSFKAWENARGTETDLLCRVKDSPKLKPAQDLPDGSWATSLPVPPTSPIGIIQVVPVSSPEAVTTSTLIDQLRKDVVPTAEHSTTLQMYVGGQTAIFDDFASVLTGKLPLFLAVIVTLGFLLLMLVFRSILVPATAAVMNILETTASFGVVVAFSQWGWGSDPLGLSGAGLSRPSYR